MHNIGFIKQASDDLSNLNSNEIVKVAGVIRDIKNWFKGLVNPEFKSRVNELERDSLRIRKLIRDLDKYLEYINVAISNGDVVKYNDSLETVKYLVKALSDELEELSESVDTAKIPEKITNKVEEVQSKDKAEDKVEDVVPFIIQKKDRVKDILKPVSSNELPEGIIRPGEILGSNNLVMSSNFDNSHSLRNRITGQITKAYSGDPIFGDVEKIKEIVNDKNFFNKIKEATGNGTVESVIYRDGGEPGLVGDYIYNVYTPQIFVDELPITFQLIVQVVDQTYNKKKPRPVKIMRLVTNVLNPLKMGPTTTGRAIPKFKNIKPYNQEMPEINNAMDVNDLADDWYLTREGILEMTSRYNKSNYVPAKRTELSKDQLVDVLKKIWLTVFKEYEMNDKALDIIVAHINLETGNTKSMFNYNFGNVKATPEWSQSHKWTSYAAGETLNGKTYKFTSKHPMSFFRAFDTIEDGISYYLQILGGRYKDALESAIEGNVSDFSNKLHDKGYYTANPKSYTSGMKRLLGESEDEENEDPSSFQQAYELAKALGVSLNVFASNNIVEMVDSSINSKLSLKDKPAIKASSRRALLKSVYPLYLKTTKERSREERRVLLTNIKDKSNVK